MSQVFPDECLLSREDRNVFLDTRFPEEYPCEGCPRQDCEIKERIHTVCAMGTNIEEDFHSMKCGRCGSRMFKWKINGRTRTWACDGSIRDYLNGKTRLEWCGFTFSTAGNLSSW